MIPTIRCYTHCVFSILSLASGVFVLAANVPYVISILRGKTSPNRISWLVWGLVGMLILTTYHELDGKAALILAFTCAACQLTVAVLSIQYGSGGTSVIDRACLALVVLTCFIWWITKSAFYPYVLGVCIDFLAMIPTFVKTYHKPEGEDFWAWTLWAIAAFLSVLAIENWAFAESLFPVYLFCVEMTMVLLLLRGKLHNPRTV